MNTFTQTYTKTDIRKAFENFHADLSMLALRTQAMETDDVDRYANDILLMAQENCLKSVHIQLRNYYGRLVKVHRYSIKEDLSDSQRPGGNKWPCLPDGKLYIIIIPSDNSRWENLQNLGKFQISWGSSFLSTDYSSMYNESIRSYSSSSYGLQRDTFVNL
ncbi:MAG: hypothetical protein OXJ52_07270 [Oligoflexia bacterium]|nr:hypothetical protein [Oligoflexia bacterium]